MQSTAWGHEAGRNRENGWNVSSDGDRPGFETMIQNRLPHVCHQPFGKISLQSIEARYVRQAEHPLRQLRNGNSAVRHRASRHFSSSQ